MEEKEKGKWTGKETRNAPVKAVPIAVEWQRPKQAESEEPNNDSFRLQINVAVVATEQEHQQHLLFKSFYEAVAKGEITAVKAFIDDGADPLTMDFNDCRTPFSTAVAYACWNGRMEMATYLLTLECLLPRKALRRDFLVLCEVKPYHQIQPMVNQYGFNLIHHLPYEGGYTPLHHACMTCNASAIRGLVNAGADWHVRVETTGATPLHMFASRFVQGKYRCMRTKRIESGVRTLEWIWQDYMPLLFVEDGSGCTPLQRILGRVDLDALRVCVIQLIALRYTE